jgi:hypothetical protein
MLVSAIMSGDDNGTLITQDFAGCDFIRTFLPQ